jgi:hypothetical protein
MVRSSLEGRVCEDLSTKGVPHEHDVPPFSVTLDSGIRTKYAPDMMIAYEGNTILITCITSYRRGDPRIRRIRSFRRDNPRMYHVILAAPPDVARRLPKDAYDDLMVL